MKKLIFILFFVPFNFSAQDVQNRILLIKEMYKETNRLMDRGNTICKKIKIEKFNDYDDIYAEYCDLDNGYSKITIEIYGPSLYDSYEYYFRYNNLYFSYIKISAEIEGIYKYRQYFNSYGELIRNLEDDGSGNKKINSAANLNMLHFVQDILLNDKTK